MKKLNEELLIECYLQGKDDIELAEIFKSSERSIQRKLSELRRQRKIPYRKELTLGENKPFFGKKNPRKITLEEIKEAIKYIGEKIYSGYRKVKLEEPKVITSKVKREELSILDIGDVHIGMDNRTFDSSVGREIETYNMEIFSQELNLLQNSIFSIHEILRNSYNLRELVIFVLGDIVTNDRIFPEQKFEIEKVVGLQIWDAVHYFTQFFNNLLRVYEKITVVGVVGNHGRSIPDQYNEPVENNFEYQLYRIWQKQFEDSKRIEIIVPETRIYVHNAWGWRHLIMHGDNMRGSSENYIEKQIKDLSLNVGNFDVMHYGHFHKLKEREISDKVTVKQNGCWILKDNYAYEKYKQYSIPKQWFFGCSRKRPETWNYKLNLSLNTRIRR